MSGYQYYEVQALDRPLSRDELAAVRALSTRATITPTRFVNEYHWGDFKGDPLTLMARYDDAHLYVANWGTRRLLLRLPRRLLDPRPARRYSPGRGRWEHGLAVHAKGEHVVLDFHATDESGESDEDDDAGEAWLASLITVRADLAGGDHRARYLGWLCAVQAGELDDAAVEPPVPPGLATLSAPLSALADFLRVGAALLAIAGERSAALPARQAAEPAPEDLAVWLRALPVAEKDDLLLGLAQRGGARAQAELLQRFRHAQQANAPPPPPGPPGGGRTAGDLLDAAEQRAGRRRRREAERAARQRAREERERAAARAAYLDSLAGREAEPWRQVEALAGTKRPKEYDQAARLVRDLRELSVRQDSLADFDRHVEALRRRHAKQPSFIGRLEPAASRPGR
jgi:hypothetical protein